MGCRYVTGCRCDVGYILAGVLSIFGHAGIIIVWGLRTSAIYNKHKVVSLLLGVVGSAVLIMLIIRAPFNKCTGPIKFQWCKIHHVMSKR
ncbi:hypothetical protein DFP72DRAFT_920439 [Ephemerocybe angulata]|uniref:Uncharacterized protein n=1 Tax=Ephemerocybe angulata TaxID=980116 RepID=A0A8H6LZV8_9AGAR|nr:hypothetical protein DFP72DRAFT_922444 [Tulosesus angulatus]KAF6747307.1 hypothetical protein DFP72DRAFT_920439 [Tulosesus angulatus]